MLATRRMLLSFVLVAALGSLVFGQGVYLTGVGAVNRSMGGAATAAPIDAMGALHWNPASISGLQQATVLRRQTEAVADSPRQRKTRLRRAEAAARRAVRIARRFQNDLPHALRESALLAALRRRDRQSQQWFQESLDIAEKQGARYEQAQTLAARAQVGHDLGWPTATTDQDAARQSFEALGNP